MRPPDGRGAAGNGATDKRQDLIMLYRNELARNLLDQSYGIKKTYEDGKR